jgi:2,3-bisphosphoglycerate-dependent phosphoglycerate mutase
MLSSGAFLIIVFETHSTSLDNEAQVASGHRDVDLSRRGEMQAASLGMRRANDGIDVVYVSDLRRSWRTAEIAFKGTNIPIVRDSRLRECDYGTLTGYPTRKVVAVRPSAVFEPFPDGESYRQATLRVARWLDDIRRQNLKRILVIGHRATHYALEHLILGIPLEKAISNPLQWRPGWIYEVPDGNEVSKSSTAALTDKPA